MDTSPADTMLGHALDLRVVAESQVGCGGSAAGNLVPRRKHDEPPSL